MQYELSMGDNAWGFGEQQVDAIKGLDKLIMIEAELMEAIRAILDDNTKINASFNTNNVYLHFNSNNLKPDLFTQLKLLFNKAGLPQSMYPTDSQYEVVNIAEKVLNEFGETMYYKKSELSTQKPKGKLTSEIYNGPVRKLKI